MLSIFIHGIIFKCKIMDVYDYTIDDLIVKCSEKMKESGYSQSCISVHTVRWKLHVKPFLSKSGTNIYSHDLGRKFLMEKLPSLSPASRKRFKRSIRILESYVLTGNIPKHTPHTPTFPLTGGIGVIAQDFINYKLKQRRQLTTIENYRRLLSYFITSLNIKGKDNITQISESDVLEFLGVKESHYYRYTAMHQFYDFIGKFHPDAPNYSYLFEFIHHQPREKLPIIYTREEVKIIESSVSRSGATGKRTYAMLLLASRLGLRISDIVGLKFYNIDWDKSFIRLKQAKTGNPIELPLLVEVGEAVIAYLKVRPQCKCDEVFVTHTCPITKMNRSGAPRLISQAILKSGVDNAGRKHGPHSMRFSLASRMLEQGTTLPTISESLGHSGHDVTMNYLRIDIHAINRCMLDVPPVKDDFYEQQNGTFFL